MAFFNPQMFCYQCEQTAHCAACTGRSGVCGKPADVARLQDQLTGALIGLARSVEPDEAPGPVAQVTIEGLFATVTNVSFDADAILELIDRVHAERNVVAPRKPAEDADLSLVWTADEDIRSLKSLVLFGIRGMAAYAYHAWVLGYIDRELNRFFLKALRAIGDNLPARELFDLALEVGEKNYRCMELLDRANTETFGTPHPTKVSMKVEAGPFIVVSGHDLLDLYALLKQTEGTGVSVYTHGEMLPAHAYPELKRFPHLKGHFGTAWQNQQREFAGIPGAVLFTTNCLMPPKKSYSDRVFTTEMVTYPGIEHVGPDKDFSHVIECALELGGYPEDVLFTGINGGDMLTTGFGHEAVLSVAGKLIGAISSGEVEHVYLVGGCDGARPGRNYYTELVEQAPKNSIILTLACGKFRFNDLDLGTVAGFPRLMDMGQCNDAYSAVQVALALADALQCSVNDLPLTIVLSWYEQKAVSVLLTLLALGVKNIKIGPTLPAFISPGVLDCLVEEFGLAPISTPQEDL